MTSVDGEAQEARRLARGICRSLAEHGFATLTEFTLKSGRRLDVLGLGGDGELLAVEIKTSLADFRADAKWPVYLEHCERFFFAVPQDFPVAVLPDDCGLMVADAYGAAVLREAPRRPLAAARRKAITLRFALTAARRLDLLVDPR